VKAAREAEGHGGTYGNHRRWHTSRGVNNPNCRFCKEAAS
jgi:hypothetical protein